MAKFNLTWDGSSVATNSNVTVIKAYARAKGSSTWLQIGTDMPKTAIGYATTETFTDNIIQEFKVECVCTLNGPTINLNGIQEGIGFNCITPAITNTSNSSSIHLTVTGLSITKAKFTLRRASNNVIVYDPPITNRLGDGIDAGTSGLSSSTNYYWQVVLYTTIKNIEVNSAQIEYLGQPCGPYSVTTSASIVCDPITEGTISSIEIP